MKCGEISATGACPPRFAPSPWTSSATRSDSARPSAGPARPRCRAPPRARDRSASCRRSSRSRRAAWPTREGCRAWRAVLVERPAAWRGALHRPRHQPRSGPLEEQLRRRRADRDVAEVEERRVAPLLSAREVREETRRRVPKRLPPCETCNSPGRCRPRRDGGAHGRKPTSNASSIDRRPSGAPARSAAVGQARDQLPHGRWLEEGEPGERQRAGGRVKRSDRTPHQLRRTQDRRREGRLPASRRSTCSIAAVTSLTSWASTIADGVPNDSQRPLSWRTNATGAWLERCQREARTIPIRCVESKDRRRESKCDEDDDVGRRGCQRIASGFAEQFVVRRNGSLSLAESVQSLLLSEASVAPEEEPMSLVRLLGFTTLTCGCVVGRYREVASSREVSYVEEKGKTLRQPRPPAEPYRRGRAAGVSVGPRASRRKPPEPLPVRPAATSCGRQNPTLVHLRPRPAAQYGYRTPSPEPKDRADLCPSS